MMDMNPTKTDVSEVNCNKSNKTVVSEVNCNKSNKTGTTCGTGTAYPSGASQMFSGVRVARSLVFCVMFCKSLFVILSFFLLAIVLSVLHRFTAFDYPLRYRQTFLVID
jgi:hypothetical protein